LPEARRHLELALRHRPKGMLPGVLMDHAVATRSLEARLLWLEGFPEQAWQAAQAAQDHARTADHPLSLAFALAFALCPVAMWNGDPLASAHVQDLVELGQSRRMPYWRDWGRCFEGAFAPPGATPPGPSKGIDLTPFHLEMMATLHPALADPATIARVDAGMAGWCAPELLRAKAERLLMRAGKEPGVLHPAERVLRQSLDLATQRGMRGWVLRSATSLARLYRIRGEVAAARQILEPVVTAQAEGFALPDYRAACAMLEAGG